jgi:two-component system response regulator FlrC
VLLMTAFGDVDKAVEAMRAGRLRFHAQALRAEKVLLAQIARYACRRSWGDDADDRRRPATREVLLAARVAATDATVLLTGESGTGKEVFARYIHRQSARAGSPSSPSTARRSRTTCSKPRCSATRRARSPARQTAQAGKFEQADGGTLLLDEISEMPLALQAKLLRVLQEREVERVGGKKPVPLDIRVLATSNRDMAAEGGRALPRRPVLPAQRVSAAHPFPARAPGDIVPLARHFLASLCRPRLARQCARTGKHHAARGHSGAR